MDSFKKWLSDELINRGWRQADLARATNLDSAVISNLVNGRRNPGEESCKAIAHAFGYPPEVVFRAAGLLPAVPAQDEQRDLLEYLFSLLPENKKKETLDYLRFQVEQTEAQKRIKSTRKSEG